MQNLIFVLQVLLIAALVLTVDSADDNAGQYVADDEGRYYPDNSGQYIPDYSGRYSHDPSGNYKNDGTGQYSGGNQNGRIIFKQNKTSHITPMYYRFSKWTLKESIGFHNNKKTIS